MNGIYMMNFFNWSYKARKGCLLAVKGINEVSIKDNEEGRKRAEEMHRFGWEIYDQEGFRW